LLGGALYASTKHAIEGYSESLDREVRTQDIRIVLVEPSFMPLSARGFRRQEPAEIQQASQLSHPRRLAGTARLPLQTKSIL
jgi:NAD(P)-dependent dehydrogenase (short-subunit alcohol dehydrogenase family)